MPHNTSKKAAKVARHVAKPPRQRDKPAEGVAAKGAKRSSRGNETATTAKRLAGKADRTTTTKSKRTAAAATPVKLLSGGNPQIAKAYGDAPVQAYIAAMPGWKRDVGRRLDALIGRTVPDVRKAVKWNTPFYGVADESQGWFVAFHCFTKYVKVTFFRGTSLRPVPPGESKQKEVRYLDIHEHDPLDEAQFAAWLKQASRLPGERL